VSFRTSGPVFGWPRRSKTPPPQSTSGGERECAHTGANHEED